LLHEGERFAEIRESKRALDAAGVIAQLPIGSLRLESQGFVTPKWRNAAATRRAGLLGESLDHGLASEPTSEATTRSAINLPEHDVERADDR
jgi:hypothetical protein